MNMTTDPRIGAGVSLLLVVFGAVMIANGSTNSVAWGWMLLAVGVLGVVANIGLYLRGRR